MLRMTFAEFGELRTEIDPPHRIIDPAKRQYQPIVDEYLKLYAVEANWENGEMKNFFLRQGWIWRAAIIVVEGETEPDLSQLPQLPGVDVGILRLPRDKVIREC